jgi:hypothetical protein
MEIRALGLFSYAFYPLLTILDIQMLLNTILFNRTDEHNDQINFLIKHFVQIEHTPTPVSYIAWRLLNKKKVIDKIAQYWNGWRSMPEMIKLYEDKLNELK